MNALAPCPPCPPFPPYPPFPANPAVGDRFGSWMWNGSAWVVAPPQSLTVNIQVFQASGAYLPSPGLQSVMVECLGGGGGGGGVNTVAVGYLATGGGGGSGGYSRKMIPAGLVLGGVTVTVGAGGASGMGTTTPPTEGGTGGVTSFGAFCVANGGQGGTSFVPLQISGAAGQPGSGAAAGTGDVTFPGATGQQGSSMIVAATAQVVAIGGLGGAILGGNSITEAWVGALNYGNPAAPGTGAGGSGGVVNQMAAGTAANGGAGGSGIVICTEYCSALPPQGGGWGCAPVESTWNECGGWGG